MKLKPVLTIAAIYLGVLGLGLFAPREIGVGAGFGGPCLGVAVLVIHLLMTVGFVVARRADSRATPGA